MNTDQIIILTGLLEFGGLVLFLKYYIGGLKQRIAALEGTIAAQQKTLETVEQRALQLEKMGEHYRQFVQNLPAAVENIVSVKDEQLAETHELYRLKIENIKALYRLEPKEPAAAETSRPEPDELRTLDFTKSISAEVISAEASVEDTEPTGHARSKKED